MKILIFALQKLFNRVNDIVMDKTFTEKVYNIVRKIPKGKVLTYKEVAEKIGKPKSFRAVGNVLNRNYDQKIPCHRVIRSDGKIGGYNKGVRKKIELLKKEKFL